MVSSLRATAITIVLGALPSDFILAMKVLNKRPCAMTDNAAM